MPLAPPYVSDEFTRFLEARNVAVLDVVRGAAPDTRRLFLGGSGGKTVGYVVAVTHGRGTPNPVDNEQDVLHQAGDVLRPSLRRCLPQVVERLRVATTLNGLVMTGVPSLVTPGTPRPKARSRELLAAAPAWLGQVWQDTATGTSQVDLGATAVQLVLHRQEWSRRVDPAIDTVRRARTRLAQCETPRTLTHGCLCPRHVITDGSVAGVEDWGLAELAGDPMRDLGRLAVGIAGARLPEVLAGRSAFAAGLRSFMAAAMANMTVPRQLWRDVLVLTQLELAVDALDRADPNEMLRLSRAVRALSGADKAEVRGTCRQS